MFVEMFVEKMDTDRFPPASIAHAARDVNHNSLISRRTTACSQYSEQEFGG
jgi:hypothetical protein